MKNINSKIREKGRKVVLVGGCFDLLHYGHVKFLKEAKKLGDYLIVALESDENVRRMKGPNRPIHPQRKRREMLESLKFVNRVISLPPLKSDQEYFALVKKIKPQVVAVTEGDALIDKKRSQARLVEAKLVMLAKIHSPSTSQLAKLLGLE